jgi:hypothetical protein
MGSGSAAPLGDSTGLSLRSFWRSSPSRNPALRVGLLLDSFKTSRFFATVIEDIRASNFANIELLICRKARAVEKPTKVEKTDVLPGLPLGGEK